MCLAVIVVFSFFTLRSATALSFIDLGGTWNLKNQDYNLKAEVPGSVYGDLMKQGIIGDIFWGYNDTATRWVAEADWIYFRKFTITKDFISHTNIRIIFEGVDTFATIFINDIEIASTDNMFLKYEFSVKSFLKEVDNLIVVKFQSPIYVAADLFEKQAANYVVPPICVPKEYHGVCHVNHIRKMQASFGWDWGPAIASVGIWKSVYVVAYNATVIKDVTVNVNLINGNDAWQVTLTTYLASTFGGSIRGTLTVQLLTDVQVLKELYYLDLHDNKNNEFVVVRSISVPQLYVKPWWPNGYGDAALYPIKITFTSEDEAEISTKSFKIGFRTIDLIQKNLTGNGTTFYFAVNNVPIFVKGANLIPLNLLPETDRNVTTARFLLKSAKAVHMNMLRVWGGGVYESDEFYEIADELGILIWQDFMFACSMYPTTEKFSESVRNEVTHQVRRLQRHPSIAIWAANNENEAALRQNWYNTNDNFTLYKKDYVNLYVHTIKDEVLKIDSSRPFLTSSPTNGVQSENEGYVARNPASTLYGDVHYYNYIADSWDQNILPVPRFASEYGYQSLPSVSTLHSATDNEHNLRYNSKFMSYRQHHLAGNEEMKTLIEYQLKLPEVDDDKFTTTFIFYSQIIQAMAYKKQTEFYRLWRSKLNSNNEGLTMGALYWQLNDVWAAPTWSSIDFQNKWKMVHYYAKDFFAPIIITGHLQADRNLKLFVVSDSTLNVYKARAMLFVYSWSSFRPIYNETFDVNLLAGLSSEVTSFWLDQYLSEKNCGTLAHAPYNCFVYLKLEDGKGVEIGPANYVFPSPLKSSNLSRTDVNISAVRACDSQGLAFEIDVTVNGITLFVWLESGNVRGLFSQNGYLQLNETQTVRFYPEQASTLDLIKTVISVTHLLDSVFKK